MGEAAKDARTLAQLAAEALAVQDACNLSGVVHGFSRSLSRLRVVLGDPSTKALNEHPIAKLWADKIGQLAGVQERGSRWAQKAYAECWALERDAVKESQHTAAQAADDEACEHERYMGGVLDADG